MRTVSLASLLLLLAPAFTGVVEGTVESSEGGPLPGVTVLVGGVAVATTDEDGAYAIELPYWSPAVSFAMGGRTPKASRVSITMLVGWPPMPLRMAFEMWVIG